LKVEILDFEDFESRNYGFQEFWISRILDFEDFEDFESRNSGF
jgi:hypothetical protein